MYMNVEEEKKRIRLLWLNNKINKEEEEILLVFNELKNEIKD